MGSDYEACKAGEVQSCWDFAQSRSNAPQDQRDALVAYQFACHLEHPESCRKLGELMGVADESNRSALASRQGCDGGDLRACVALADEMPRVQARATLTKACDQDIGEACLKLAKIQGGNWRIQENLDQAFRLNLKACELEVYEGCVRAGQSLVFGSGVERDSAKGIELLEKACDANVVEGCLVLAKIFEDGMGVESDRERAAGYYELAKGEGPESRLFATTFILHADGCARSMALACFNAAEMRREGDEVERNVTIAHDLYREACRNDVSSACSKAGELEVRQPGEEP